MGGERVDGTDGEDTPGGVGRRDDGAAAGEPGFLAAGPLAGVLVAIVADAADDQRLFDRAGDVLAVSKRTRLAISARRSKSGNADQEREEERDGTSVAHVVSRSGRPGRAGPP